MSDLTDFLLARIAEDEAVAREAAARPLRARGKYSPLTSGGQPPEQTAMDAINVMWYRHDDGWSGSDSGLFPAGQVHFDRFDSARILAECAAKRRVIGWHQNWPTFIETEPIVEPIDSYPEMTLRVSQRILWATNREYVARFGSEPPTAPILLMMAQVYADHPDFREEWLA